MNELDVIEKYELDFHNVINSEGENCKGDAITLRYEKEGVEKIILIDGGTQKMAECLHKNMESYYGGNLKIDLAIITHPHEDHMSALKAILEDEKITVKKIWCHDNEKSKDLIKIAKAKDKDIIFHPKAGEIYDNVLKIISPTDDFYQEMLAMEESIENSVIYEEENKQTAPLNEISFITCFKTEKGIIVLTGDAGKRAFEKTEDFFQDNKIHIFQIPHHGSHRNISEDIIENFSTTDGAFAICSAPSDDEGKHPNDDTLYWVSEKFDVYTTEGSGFRHNKGYGAREGFSTATPKKNKTR